MNHGGFWRDVKFVMAVRDPVPFLIGGACCFRWVLQLGPYQNGSTVENVTNIAFYLEVTVHVCGKFITDYY